MRENAIQDHKNCLLHSQDSGQTELKVSEFTMKSIEFSRISQNSIVMEWMQFRAPRSAGRIGRAAATAARWRSWWALMVVGLISAQQDRHLAVVATPLPALPAAPGGTELYPLHDYGILTDP